MPIHDSLLVALRRHGIPNAGYLFLGSTGRKLSPERVGELVTDALSSIDGRVTTHQLRHWFGSEVYRHSKDLRLTQELLGHADPGTTAIYTAWSRDDAQAVVGRLDLD